MIGVSLRTTIIDLMLSFRKELGLTYLFVTHDLAVAKYISDRIAVMYLGKIVEIGNKESLFSNPLHPYTRALLSAIPVPDPKRKRQMTELKGEVPSAINVPLGCRFNPRCPRKKKGCTDREPELVEAEKDHFVACPLYWKSMSRRAVPVPTSCVASLMLAPVSASPLRLRGQHLPCHGLPS